MIHWAPTLPKYGPMVQPGLYGPIHIFQVCSPHAFLYTCGPGKFSQGHVDWSSVWLFNNEKKTDTCHINLHAWWQQCTTTFYFYFYFIKMTVSPPNLQSEENLEKEKIMAENSSNGGAATTLLLRSVVVVDGEMNASERPKEPWKGEFVKSIVYAGLDAIVTSFSLISSISAGRLSSGKFPAMGIIFSFFWRFYG